MQPWRPTRRSHIVRPRVTGGCWRASPQAERCIEISTAEDAASLKGEARRTWTGSRSSDPEAMIANHEGRHDPSGLQARTTRFDLHRIRGGRRATPGRRRQIRRWRRRWRRPKILEAVFAAPTAGSGRMVTDKGYHSRSVLKALDDGPWKRRISDAQAERFCALARRRRSRPSPATGSPPRACQGTTLQGAPRSSSAPLRTRGACAGHVARARERAQAIHVAGHQVCLLSAN